MLLPPSGWHLNCLFSSENVTVIVSSTQKLLLINRNLPPKLKHILSVVVDVSVRDTLFGFTIWGGGGHLSSNLLNVTSVYSSTVILVFPDVTMGVDEPCGCNHDMWLGLDSEIVNEQSWRMSMHFRLISQTGFCTANGSRLCEPLQRTALRPRDWKATWVPVFKDCIFLLRTHWDTGLYIIQRVLWTRCVSFLGQRLTTVPRWAGPGCASSSIMQSMARMIIHSHWHCHCCSASLITSLDSNLKIFILDTGLLFQNE